MELKHLPLELWLHVASYLCHLDLTSLALVSSLHLVASRPNLYKDLRLWVHPRQEYQGGGLNTSTIDLLQADQGTLARYVVRLELSGRSHAAASSVFHDALLSNTGVVGRMINLRSLSMSFTIHDDIQTLVSVLTKKCPLLEDVSFDQSYCGIGGDRTRFELAGVKRLKWWNSAGGNVTPFGNKIFQSIVASSSTTITHIILPNPWTVADSSVFASFMQPENDPLRFPALESFAIGPFIQPDALYVVLDNPDDDLAEFLYQHPSITTLDLGWSAKSACHAEITWDTAFVPGNFLPNLISLDAHAEVVQFLAHCCPATLRNVADLRTGAGSDIEGAILVVEMTHTLLGIGGLPNLKRVVLVAPASVIEHEPHDGFSKWMADVAKAFPALEEWEGDVPTDMPLIPLVRIFSKFTFLRRIHLNSSLPTSTGDEIISLIESGTDYLDSQQISSRFASV